MRLVRSGAIFLHCYRSSIPGKEGCKRDFALAVEMEAAVALRTRHGLSHVDIPDHAQYLKHFHLVPPLEPLKLVETVNQPPSLPIRCDTGSGKTVYLEALIKANNEFKFVAITPRRTHADMLEKRFHRFENYQDRLRGVIACERLVIQTESLHRIDMKYYRDDTILILDETSSLIKQMCSDKTHGNMHNLNLQIFERPIRRAKRAICLDADLSNEEIEIMKSLRSDFLVIDNTFRQQRDDKVVLFDDMWKLIKEVLVLLKARKRLYISSTMSAKWTEALDTMLTEGGFKGECVTKNTEEEKKRDIGKNINDTVTDFNYFIHTPTISVGVDYNVKDHVDYVVGIFSTHSEVDVETCMQMMRRVRHVKSKTYLVHANGTTVNLPTTAQEVREWICNQLNIFTGKVQASPTLKLQLDDNDDLTILDDLYHRMYCHVMAKKHLSMNGFRSRLIQRAAQAGCFVTGNGDKLSLDDPIITAMKDKLGEITTILNQQIAGAAPISPDEFEELSRGTQELSAAQRASVHKFALMRTYDIREHSIVSEEWVEVYDNPYEKECYKNLSTLSRRSGPSLHSCLSIVQQREELGLEYSLRGAPTSAEAHNRLEKSQFTKLKYAVDILTTCGFEDTFATNEVLSECLKSRIDEIWVWAGLESNMSQICTTLKAKWPTHKNWTFKHKLTFINTVLHTVLGVKIRTPESNKRRTKYGLNHYSSVGSAKNSPLFR